MKKRYAANIVFKDGELIKNAMVEIEDGRVVRIVPLFDFSNEPAATLFYNGIITLEPVSEITEGSDLRSQAELYICVGSEDSQLVLWKNVSFETFIKTERTEIIRL